METILAFLTVIAIAGATFSALSITFAYHHWRGFDDPQRALLEATGHGLLHFILRPAIIFAVCVCWIAARVLTA